MALHSICQICGEEFQLKKKEEKLVISMLEKGQTFIMIQCPECGRGTRYVDPKNASQLKTRRHDTEAQYRCPKIRCSGWVNHIDESVDQVSFWGCGECGNIWHDLNALYSEINTIVDKYPYRKSCYKKVDKTWLPADPNNEEKDYESRVEQESINKNKRKR